MANSIKHTVFFQHKPEAVWEYLTNAELISQWLMKNDFLPIVGHEFQFRTNPYPKLDFDGIVYCKVLEIVPYEKLVYSWKGGPGNGKITMDSIVEWKLVEKDNGTALFLEHSGFKEIENLAIYSAMDDGWFKNMHKIIDLLNAVKHGSTNA